MRAAFRDSDGVLEVFEFKHMRYEPTSQTVTLENHSESGIYFIYCVAEEDYETFAQECLTQNYSRHLEKHEGEFDVMFMEGVLEEINE